MKDEIMRLAEAQTSVVHPMGIKEGQAGLDAAVENLIAERNTLGARVSELEIIAKLALDALMDISSFQRRTRPGVFANAIDAITSLKAAL